MARTTTKLESIENTAMKLFGEKGIKEVSIKEISAHANCSEGALYRHYKSKDEMAWLLYKREVEKFGTLLRGIYESEQSLDRKLYNAIELFYDFFDREPVKFNFILLSQHNFPRELVVDQELNPFNLLYNFLKEGNKSGVFNIKDINLYVALIYGLIVQPPMFKATDRLEGKMKNKTKTVFENCIKLLTR